MTFAACLEPSCRPVNVCRYVREPALSRRLPSPFSLNDSAVLSPSLYGGYRRVQTMHVSLRVLEHGPTAPRLAARRLGELDLFFRKLLLCRVDVVHLKDDATRTARLGVRPIGAAQRK